MSRKLHRRQGRGARRQSRSARSHPQARAGCARRTGRRWTDPHRSRVPRGHRQRRHSAGPRHARTARRGGPHPAGRCRPQRSRRRWLDATAHGRHGRPHQPRATTGQRRCLSGRRSTRQVWRHTTFLCPFLRQAIHGGSAFAGRARQPPRRRCTRPRTRPVLRRRELDGGCHRRPRLLRSGLLPHLAAHLGQARSARRGALVGGAQQPMRFHGRARGARRET